MPAGQFFFTVFEAGPKLAGLPGNEKIFFVDDGSYGRMGLLIYDSVATFQAFNPRGTYLWPNLPNGTLNEHVTGLAWASDFAIRYKRKDGSSIGMYLSLIGGLAGKKDAPGGGEGLGKPGLYEVGWSYRVPVNL